MSTQQPEKHPSRLLQVLLAAAGQTICYADRTNIAVAGLAMQKELGWSETQLGLVLGSFFGGYIVTQIPAGILSSGGKGPKPVLLWGMVFWSVCTLLTPFCARVSFPVLIICRLLMGLGEGVSQPAIHGLVGNWVGPDERSRAMSFITAGQPAGIAIAMLSSPLVNWWWPSIFLLYGVIGLVWAFFFALFGASSPLGMVQEIPLLRMPPPNDDSNDTNRDERSNDQPNSAPTVMTKDEVLQMIVPLFRSTSFLAAAGAHFAYNCGFYVLIMWVPKYFSSFAGVDLKSLGHVAVLPYLSMGVFSVIWGNLADALLQAPTNRGTFHIPQLSLLQVRKLCEIIGMGGQIVCLLIVAHTSIGKAGTGVWAVVGVFCCLMACGSAVHSGHWANLVDLGPSKAGMLCGLSNTFATIPGMVANVAVGAVLDATNSWTLVFHSIVTCYGLGLVLFLVFASTSRIL